MRLYHGCRSENIAQCVRMATARMRKVSKREFRNNTMAKQRSQAMFMPFRIARYPMKTAPARKKQPVTSIATRRAAATTPNMKKSKTSHGLILRANGVGGPENASRLPANTIAGI